MTDVRSQTLAVYATVDANWRIVYTSPTANVTLLKGIEVFNAGAVATNTRVYAATDTGVEVPLVSKNFVVGEALHQVLWMALNPGSFLLVQSDISGVQFWLSGAVLQGAPPVPPQTPTIPTFAIELFPPWPASSS